MKNLSEFGKLQLHSEGPFSTQFVKFLNQLNAIFPEIKQPLFLSRKSD